MDAEKRNIEVLTELDVLEKSRSYVPNAEKAEFVEYASTRCFDRMELSTEEGESVPPMWKENAARKMRYMTAALAKLYLSIPADAEGWELSEAEYDRLAESQLVSQLERMKKSTKNTVVRDKLYDLLADYRVLEKLLNAECFGLLSAMNDTVARLKSLLSAAVTPEAMQEMQTQAEALKNEFDSYLKNRVIGQ